MIAALNALVRRLVRPTPAAPPAAPPPVAPAPEPAPPPAPPDPPRRVWLDVGAHLGEKTFGPAAADPALTVYAFEPIWEMAAQRIGRLPNYVVVPVAVAEAPGTAEFHLNQFAAASSLLPFDPDGLDRWSGGEVLRDVRVVAVPTWRLDRFLDAMGVGEVEFLKIDAQGADFQVLRSLGDRLAHVRSLNLEVQITPRQLYVGGSAKQEVIDYLSGRGFALTGTEVQSRGQEENLTFENRRFVPPPADPKPDPMMTAAAEMAVVRPIAPYPGWAFGAGEDDPAVQERKQIWSYCHQRKEYPPVVLPWLDGLTVRLPMGDDFTRLLFITGCYEPNEFWFLSRYLKPGMTVLDAGANVGLYASFFGKRVGPAGAVWAVEPSLREFARLVDTVARNRLDMVKPVPVALADRDGVAELRISEPGHGGQNTLGGFAHAVEEIGTQAVAVRTLDTFARTVGVKRLDLIKMDVEGAELALVRGGREVIARDRPVILFEANDRALQLQGASTADLLAELTGLGYELFAMADDGLYRPAGNRRSDNMVAAHPTNMPADLRDPRPAGG